MKAPYPSLSRYKTWIGMGFVFAQALQPALATDSWNSRIMGMITEIRDKTAAQVDEHRSRKTSAPAAEASAPATVQALQPQILRGNRFTVNTSQTADSSIYLDGSVPRDTDRLLVRASRQGSSQGPRDSYFILEGTQFSRRVYLYEGAGTYQVSIYTCPQAEGMCPWIDTFKIQNSDPLDQSHLLPSAEVQSDAPQIIALARELTVGLTSDREKSRSIHEWVIRNIQYDVENYFNGSWVNNKYDALTVLNNRITVCEGYSKLIAALHRAAGIRAKFVVGIGSPTEENQGLGSTTGTDSRTPNHGWNEVFIDGRWISMDATWDAGSVDPISRRYYPNPRTKYFESSAAEFAIEHLKIRDEEA